MNDLKRIKTAIKERRFTFWRAWDIGPGEGLNVLIDLRLVRDMARQCQLGWHNTCNAICNRVRDLYEESLVYDPMQLRETIDSAWKGTVYYLHYREDVYVSSEAFF